MKSVFYDKHKLLVADITADGSCPTPRIVPPRRKAWKLRDPSARND